MTRSTSHSIDYIISPHRPCISLGKVLYKKTKTCVRKQLLIDGATFSFTLLCSLNGAKRRGNICTMFLLIDYDCHSSLCQFVSHISTALDIPNLASPTFPSNLKESQYILSIRIPIAESGFLWKGVSVNCIDPSFDNKVIDWPEDYKVLVDLEVEGVHFSDLKDRNTCAHVNFVLKGIDRNPKESPHISEQTIDNQEYAVDELVEHYKQMSTSANDKLLECEQELGTIRELYENCKKDFISANNRLTSISDENTKSEKTINMLSFESERLKVELESSKTINGELTVSKEILKQNLQEVKAENKKLTEETKIKDISIFDMKEWLENIIPYYKHYTNDTIEYGSFSSYTATSRDLNSLNKSDIKKLALSGSLFQSLPFQRLYARALVEVIKCHDRDDNVGLKDILSEHRLLVEKLLTAYYNDESLTKIENYTTGRNW